MADPFSESLDLLAEGNTEFSEFSIDSFDDEDEEELNKFINGDLDDDDPLGILGETKQELLQQKPVAEVEEQKSIDDSTGTSSTSFELVAEEKQSVQATSNSNTAGGVTNQALAIPTVHNNDNGTGYTPVIPCATESGSGTTSSSSSSNSTNANNKLGSSSAVSALKKQVVAATEDPLSTTWTNPMSSGTTTAPTAANVNVSTTHNGTHLPYPNVSHTVNPSNNPNVPTASSTMASSYMGTTGIGMGTHYNSADVAANLANFVTKTQSLTSSFSSFASKFQDAVSNAAIVSNTSAKPVVQSRNISSSGSQSGYSQQSMNRMHGAGGGGPIGVGNVSVGMHGNHPVAAGFGNNTTNGATGAVYDAPIAANSVGNANIANGGTAGPATRVQDIDKAKRSAILHSAVGSLLPGEEVIMFISNLRDVKDTSSPHSVVGTSQFCRDRVLVGNEKWCCAMTLYRIIVFSFRELEFSTDGADKTNEGTDAGRSQIDEWVSSASVSRQFQAANQHRNAGGKFHQVIQMPIGAIDRVEKSTDFVSNSSQMGFSSSSLMGSSTLYADSLGGSVANGTLVIYGKDNGRLIQFTTPSYADCMGAYQHLNEYAFPGKKRLGFLFAFESRKAEVLASVIALEGENINSNPAGRITSRATPRRYDPLAEFQRMVSISPDIQYPWRPLLKANATYNACASYPSIVFGPSTINDETPEGMGIVRDIASFRSGQRFQTLSWASRHDGASLWRCAQPKVGIQGNRNSTDERYIQMIGECAALANSQAVMNGKMPPRPSVEFLRMLTGGITSELMLESYERQGTASLNEKCMVKIMDLRPKSSAMANRTGGYGYENTSYYKNTTLSFHGIGNIHAVRDSYQKLNALCANATANDVQWMQLVEETKWLSHIRLILSASWQAAFHVKYNRLPVLLHCSHGWDRTSQVCALSQIFLDPYYRTRVGFSCLVEKDFLALGHPFHLRSGHGEGRGDRNNSNSSSQVDEGQMSQIFIQFLDCVWQILNQYPDYFEFNSKYVFIVSEHVYSCRFGTLLCDTEREREAVASIRQRTPCLWEFLDSSPELLNKSYRPITAQGDKFQESGSLMMPISSLLRNVSLWTDRFCMYSAKPTDRCLPSELAHDISTHHAASGQVLGRVGRFEELELERVQAEVAKWKRLALQKDEEIYALKQKLKTQECEDSQDLLA